MPYGFWGSYGPKESCRIMGSDPLPREWLILRGKWAPIVKYRDFMLRAMQNRLNRFRCWLGYGLGWAQQSMCYMGWGRHWHNLSNTAEPSVFRWAEWSVGDANIWQITLTTCCEYVLLSMVFCCYCIIQFYMTAVLSDVLMTTAAHMMCNNEIDKSQPLETAACLTTLGYFIFNWPSFSRFCQEIGW